MTTVMLNCPMCGSTDVVPVVYGNMRQPALDLALQARINLASSLTSDDSPLWYCKGCMNDLGPGMGQLWQQSAWSDLHTHSIQQTFSSYKALSEQERRFLGGKQGLETIVAIVFSSSCLEARMWHAGNEGHLIGMQENGPVELPSPPMHMVITIFEYIASVLASLPVKGADFRTEVPVQGKTRAFVVTIEKHKPDSVVVIRPVDNYGL